MYVPYSLPNGWAITTKLGMLIHLDILGKWRSRS